MLNYLWAGMILIGIVTAALTGRMPEITNAAIGSSQEAVQVCLTMLGIMSMWTGLMKIAETSGMIKGIARRMRPFLRLLFPSLSPQSKAMDYIATNTIANILGLGWAATPAGIKAMEELQKTNPDKTSASKEMCMFMIFNMSSLQIISVNLIAYRTQYNSANPSEIIGPGLLATLVSTVAAILSVKVFEMFYFGKTRKPSRTKLDFLHHLEVRAAGITNRSICPNRKRG
ncbi:MAG: nucleoside recognition protein [Clostridiales bacterium]|jgi:spore maturation protein A|nr:nucleoside recognition protein [Clostridiales bacterium]